ncbi:MAG: histidinol-phosphate transaminase [Clostridia bacterium]|nr:histidinol-phosphate transaminase [Clostridia bacterium]
MSKFISTRLASLEAYVPGEQPQDKKYIKLNTNESPFPPSASVISAAKEEAGRLQLYSDPSLRELRYELAALHGVAPENVIATNGSDEVLDFSFLAFSDAEHPIVFPDITYGFYSVFADLYGIPYERIPLDSDFRVRAEDYIGISKNIVIANPNAPTGLALSLADIELIVASNPDNIVIIDEAYVDFGGESAVALTKKYKNLIVTGTFSKSRSLAGARLGFGIADAELISDLDKIRCSHNPYNVNRMTAAAGCAALRDNAYYMQNCKTVIENREYTKRELRERGFFVTDSLGNFLFAESKDISGDELYLGLRERGILVRHLSGERIKNFNRISIGTREDMDKFLSAVDEILKEKKYEMCKN